MFDMLNLLKLLLEYSKRGKLVDKEFAERLVQTEIEKHNLREYITKVNVLNSKPKEAEIWGKNSINTGNYNQITHEISIFMEEMEKMLEFYKTIFGSYTGSSKFLYQNSVISRAIIHETSHAYNLKKQQLYKTIEADILKLSYDLSFMDYAMNYNCIPDERLAEIRANDYMRTALSYLAKEVPELLEYFKVQELKRTLRGYSLVDDICISPTLHFVHNANLDWTFSQFDWYDEESFNSVNEDYKASFSLSERLLFGFPIDHEEFDAMKQVLNRYKKYDLPIDN